jgi:hypothetical protein
MIDGTKPCRRRQAGTAALEKERIVWQQRRHRGDVSESEAEGFEVKRRRVDSVATLSIASAKLLLLVGSLLDS